MMQKNNNKMYKPENNGNTIIRKTFDIQIICAFDKNITYLIQINKDLYIQRHKKIYTLTFIRSFLSANSAPWNSTTSCDQTLISYHPTLCQGRLSMANHKSGFPSIELAHPSLSVTTS